MINALYILFNRLPEFIATFCEMIYLVIYLVPFALESSAFRVSLILHFGMQNQVDYLHMFQKLSDDPILFLIVHTICRETQLEKN